MKPISFARTQHLDGAFPERSPVKIGWRFSRQEEGFTLPEVVISVAILSIFIIISLTVFSHTYGSINRADLDLDLLHEAHMFLGQFSKDVRSASEIVTQHGGFRSSEKLLILKLSDELERDQEKEAYVIYHYEPGAPENSENTGKIRRIAFPVQGGIDLLSQDVKNLKFNLSSSQTVEVELDLEKRLYGITRSLRVQTAYHMGGK